MKNQRRGSEEKDLGPFEDKEEGCSSFRVKGYRPISPCPTGDRRNFEPTYLIRESDFGYGVRSHHK